MTSPPPAPTSPQVRRALELERPELLEEWTEEGSLEAHLERLRLNAEWDLDRLHKSKASWTSPVRERARLTEYAIVRVVWMATPDDLYNWNTFDRNPDDAPLNETELRSGWFSISSTSDANPPRPS